MKILHFDNVYRQIDTSLRLMAAWLYDSDGEWALRLPVSLEDSAEFMLFKGEDNASLYDAVSPSTLPFIGQLISAVQVQVISIEIRVLLERAFYGVATFQQGAQTFEIPGRVGFLLALTLRFACPIMIEEELLTRRGVRLPPQTTLQQWLTEEQANVYQKILLSPQHTPTSAHLETFMRQAPGKPLTAEQRQQVQAEIQQGLGPEQRKQLQQLYKNLPPESRKVSKEMWKQLGFPSPPLPQEVLEDENEADPQ